jgi:hypothetical protein
MWSFIACNKNIQSGFSDKIFVIVTCTTYWNMMMPCSLGGIYSYTSKILPQYVVLHLKIFFIVTTLRTKSIFKILIIRSCALHWIGRETNTDVQEQVMTKWCTALLWPDYFGWWTYTDATVYYLKKWQGFPASIKCSRNICDANAWTSEVNLMEYILLFLYILLIDQ